MRCGSSPPCAPSSSTLEADNRLAERRTWPDLSLPSCVLVSIDELFHVGTRGAVFCFKSGRHSSAVRLDTHGSLGACGSCMPHNGTSELGQVARGVHSVTATCERGTWFRLWAMLRRYCAPVSGAVVKAGSSERRVLLGRTD